MIFAFQRESHSWRLWMMDESALIAIQGLYGFRVATTKAIPDISFSLSKQLNRQGLEANQWLLPLIQRV